jgi:hypothetical protein
MDADLAEKLARLAALGRELGASTLVLREQASLSWLLGARSYVPQTLDAPRLPDLVPAGSVVAWNPSGGGWKVEDTCLVGADGPRPLVHDDTWPTVTVAGRARPDVLERP